MTAIPGAVAAPKVSMWQSVKTWVADKDTRFAVWTSKYTVDVNAKLGVNESDGTLKKAAKVFFRLLASIALSPFSLAANLWSSMKQYACGTVKSESKPQAPPPTNLEDKPA